MTELALLGLAFAVSVAAALPLAIEGQAPVGWHPLAAPVALGVLFAVLHVGLVVGGSRTDPVLLPVVLALLGLGACLNARLAPALASRQWSWTLLGVLALIVVVLSPLDEQRVLRRYRYTWASLGMALVAVTLAAGRSAATGGPRLWLGVGSIGFQPSEVLKLLLVVFLASYLEDKQELLSDAATRIGPIRLPPLPYVAPMVAMLGLSLALLAAQRDLGAALLLFSISLGMLYLASGRLDYVLAGLTLFVAGAYALHARLGMVQTRLAIWFDPWSQSQDAGYQIVQSLMAIGSGGLIGTGLGLGSPDSIPAVHTDFVYAAVAEELGLAGALGVLGLYSVLVLRGFRVAVGSRQPFTRLLSAGLTLSMALQVFIIVGGAVKMIPLTGITLPLLSHGGTSMLVSLVMLGLLVRASEPNR